MIVKTKSGFKLVSKTSGRVLGHFDSREAAEKRERQIQFFKNLEHSSGGKGSLAGKVRKKSLLG